MTGKPKPYIYKVACKIRNHSTKGALSNGVKILSNGSEISDRGFLGQGQRRNNFFKLLVCRTGDIFAQNQLILLVCYHMWRIPEILIFDTKLFIHCAVGFLLYCLLAILKFFTVLHLNC